MSDSKRDIIVVGGGLAGLMCVIRICELGGTAKLFSLVPCKRSHSVCAQGGINGAVNTMGEGDHPDIHTFDTLKGGEFVNDQVLAQEMCLDAPGVIFTMDRMGVPFSRTPEGNLAFRRFGGTLHHRTAHAGASTGQQLLYALDEQVRRFESEGKVTRFEFWDLIDLVKDSSGNCIGIVAQDLRSMEMRSFAGDAVLLATGGYGLIYGKSTCSQIVTGSATAIAYKNGAVFANPEFVQVHPTCIPGEDKLRLMSESARGEGGRVWVPRQKGDPREGKDIPENERLYFLEEKYPVFKNLVPRDVASREIFFKYLEGYGVGGKPQVYLDLSQLDSGYIRKKLGAILEIYEKFAGEDPTEVPMLIFPGVHYTMGGVCVDYEANSKKRLNWESPKNQMSTVPGLYALGEADHQYHGANRLGANSLLSCLFSGRVAAQAALAYQRGLKKHADQQDSSLYESKLKQNQQNEQAIRRNTGENPYRLHKELGELMTKNVLVIRDNKSLDETLVKLAALRERAQKAAPPDASANANHGVTFTRWLQHMVDISWAVCKAARLRDEFRGAHYKPEFELAQPADMKYPDFKAWLDVNRPASLQEHYKNWYGDKPPTDEHKATCASMKPDHAKYFADFAELTAKWCKPTHARFTPNGPEISYGKTKMELMPPVPRKYD